MAIPSEAAFTAGFGMRPLPNYFAVAYTGNEEPTMPNTNLKVSKAGHFVAGCVESLNQLPL
jgi:hypothetical protein